MKAWSKTQTNLTMSSVGAELVALTKASCEGLGAKSMLKDLGREVEVTMWTDASAALSIIHRLGVGKLRHIDVGMLWIQQEEAQRLLNFQKIWGEENPADLFTKRLPQQKIEKFMTMLNEHRVDGRADSAMKLQAKTL